MKWSLDGDALPRQRVDALTRADVSTRRRVDASTRQRVNAPMRRRVDASTRRRVDASTRRRVDLVPMVDPVLASADMKLTQMLLPLQLPLLLLHLVSPHVFTVKDMA